MIIFGIEDMIANAIIELVERGSRREVLFSEANRYVEEVVQILSQQNKNAIFVTSKDGLNDFLHDNSDFFELSFLLLPSISCLQQQIETNQYFQSEIFPHLHCQRTVRCQQAKHFPLQNYYYRALFQDPRLSSGYSAYSARC